MAFELFEDGFWICLDQLVVGINLALFRVRATVLKMPSDQFGLTMHLLRLASVLALDYL